MNPYEKKLIDDLILPAFTQVTLSQKLINSLYELCRLHQVTKYQLLELPGPYYEGRLWFSVSAMVQAYYFCPDKQCKWGTRIWRKREFILNSASLLNQEFRTDYIEVLEPGNMLSITYVDLLSLIVEFPELEKQVQNIAACNERYYYNRTQLLNRPPFERVQQFEKENPLFVNVAGKDAIAMHVGLTRQGYYSQLKKNSFSSPQ
uniref:Crp/Fnr family transcriptional regulator n=1 Tax=Pedobacter schmidteae TaxID=2201271 RepID=UPI000EB43BEB|nr:Crp/Fnr family transcriptional regulator [Pedobacter schmidteae]